MEIPLLSFLQLLSILYLLFQPVKLRCSLYWRRNVFLVRYRLKFSTRQIVVLLVMETQCVFVRYILKF